MGGAVTVKSHSGSLLDSALNGACDP